MEELTFHQKIRFANYYIVFAISQLIT